MGLDPPQRPQPADPPQIQPIQAGATVAAAEMPRPPQLPEKPAADTARDVDNATMDPSISPRRSSEDGKDRKGTLITRMDIDMDANRVAAISPEGNPVRGDVSTDLTYGLYSLKTDTRNKQWVFPSSQVKPGLRFHVDLNGVKDPFDLVYADSFPLVVSRGFQESGKQTLASLKATVSEAVADLRWEDAFAALDLIGDVDLYDLVDEIWLDDPGVINALLLNASKVILKKDYDVFRIVRALESFSVPAEKTYVDAFDKCLVHPASFARTDEVRERLGKTNIRLVFTYDLTPPRAVMLFADDISSAQQGTTEPAQYGEAALRYPRYCNATTTPRMLQAKKDKIQEIESQNIQFFITAYSAVETVINMVVFASGVMMRSLPAGQAVPRLSRPITEAFESQPGRWMPDFEGGLNMSEDAAAYQARVCKASSGWGYYVNGVQFDGYETNLLTDAKFYADGGRMSQALARQDYWAGTKMLNQAARQVNAANGLAVEWRVAGQTATTQLQELFRVNNVPIRVVYVP
jgi:hypothetical protein